jgi:hypothetical protein
MALTSGLAGQFGVEVEGTSGTYETPTHFLEFINEAIKLNITQVASNGIRAGRRTRHAMVPSTRVVEGPSSHELTAETVGEVFRLMFGAVNTSGSNPYTHVFTPGDLPSGTVQVGTPGTGGTVHPRSYLGMRVASWTLTVSPSNTFAMLEIQWIGRDETTSETLASASYATFTRFTFAHATFSIAGSEVCVDEVTISGNNNLNTTHKVCSADAGKPSIREAGWRDYTLTAVADFADLTQYNRYKNATEVAFELELNAGSSAILTIAGNVHFIGETPNVSGPEVLKQPIPATFVHGTSDASAITATLVNADSAP